MSSLLQAVSAPILSNNMNLSSHPIIVGLASILFATSGFILSIFATAFHTIFGNADLPPEVNAKDFAKRHKLRSASATRHPRLPPSIAINDLSQAQFKTTDAESASPLGLSCPAIITPVDSNDDSDPQQSDNLISGVEFRQGFKFPGLKPLWIGEKPKLSRSHSSPALPQLVLQSPSPPASPLFPEAHSTPSSPTTPKKKEKTVRKIPSAPSLKLSSLMNASSKKGTTTSGRKKAARSLTLPTQEAPKIKPHVEGGFLAPPS
ncbi:hypothetical protein AX16_000315 [Volvariella volvacea WC 439]|nr:hypothetical protein AX16_000315 [Volvariella volvacea WC 439]